MTLIGLLLNGNGSRYGSSHVFYGLYRAYNRSQMHCSRFPSPRFRIIPHPLALQPPDTCTFSTNEQREQDPARPMGGFCRGAGTNHVSLFAGLSTVSDVKIYLFSIILLRPQHTCIAPGRHYLTVKMSTTRCKHPPCATYHYYIFDRIVRLRLSLWS